MGVALFPYIQTQHYEPDPVLFLESLSDYNDNNNSNDDDKKNNNNKLLLATLRPLWLEAGSTAVAEQLQRALVLAVVANNKLKQWKLTFRQTLLQGQIQDLDSRMGTMQGCLWGRLVPCVAAESVIVRGTKSTTRACRRRQGHFRCLPTMPCNDPRDCPAPSTGCPTKEKDGESGAEITAENIECFFFLRSFPFYLDHGSVPHTVQVNNTSRLVRHVLAS